MDEPDELTSLEVYNAVWPHDAVTIDAVHSFRDSAQDYIDYLVREDGVIAGSGAGAIFAYRARRVVTLITVLAGQRRRGHAAGVERADVGLRKSRRRTNPRGRSRDNRGRVSAARGNAGRAAWLTAVF